MRKWIKAFLTAKCLTTNHYNSNNVLFKDEQAKKKNIYIYRQIYILPTEFKNKNPQNSSRLIDREGTGGYHWGGAEVGGWGG